MRRTYGAWARVFLWVLLAFSLFMLSTVLLPKYVPESYLFLVDILDWALWLLFMLVVLALVGIGPFARSFNKVAIEEDEETRKAYRVKQPWDE
jgi:hypothetical protein